MPLACFRICHIFVHFSVKVWKCLVIYQLSLSHHLSNSLKTIVSNNLLPVQEIKKSKMAKVKKGKPISQENVGIIKSNSKQLKRKKLKEKRASEATGMNDGDTLLVDTDTVESQSKNANKIPKIRRSASTENVEENFMIVPWASREEWDNVCLQFHERNYKDVIAKIGMWQQRVPSLPVGVEATLFLLEALSYDDKFITSTGRNKEHYTEDQARSLYSLAIIRYLNHVSQLATQSLGGPSKRLTRELAAMVDTPEWLVALRNDVSHGPSAPSIEVLRMGGDFVLQWLKEKYWKLPEELTTSAASHDPFTILSRTDGVDVSLQLSELFAAYIAARIYKMRRVPAISDPEIIRHIPTHSSPVKTKVAVMTIKTLIRPFVDSHPSLFCVAASQELIPNLEFYEDFKSLVKCKESENRDDVAFDKLYGLWMPIIKLLQSKGKLMTILSNLAELVVNSECEKMWVLSARWIEKLLEMIENSGKKYSKHLVNILGIVIKHPNYSMHHFLERLFRLTEPRLGSEAVQKLAYLSSIWLEEKSETKKRRKQTAVKLFSLSDINDSSDVHDDEGDAQIESSGHHESEQSTILWTPDERSEDFWRNIPVGGIL